MYAFFAFYKTRLPQKCNMYFLFKLRIGLASQSKIEKSCDFMFAGSERNMNSEHGKILCFCLSKKLFFDEKCHFCSRASCGLLTT